MMIKESWIVIHTMPNGYRDCMVTVTPIRINHIYTAFH